MNVKCEGDVRLPVQTDRDDTGDLTICP